MCEHGYDNPDYCERCDAIREGEYFQEREATPMCDDIDDDDPEQFLLPPLFPEHRLQRYVVDGWNAYYTDGEVSDGEDIRADVRDVLAELRKLRDRVGPTTCHSLSLQAYMREWLDKLKQDNTQLYEQYRDDIDVLVKLADAIAYKLHPDRAL